MEWDQLSFLGPGLQTKLRDVYRDVGTLYFAFEDLTTDFRQELAAMSTSSVTAVFRIYITPIWTVNEVLLKLLRTS